MMTSLHSICRITWITLLGTACMSDLAIGLEPPFNSPPTRDALSAWLQHEENRVRTATCRFSKVVSTTDPDMIPLIKEACRRRGNEGESARYIYSEKTMKAQSSITWWWRDGDKEQFEAVRLADFDPKMPEDWEPTSMHVYDGATYRSLGQDTRTNEWNGSIQPRSEWTSDNRPGPRTFLYCFTVMPYSEIVSRSSMFDVSQVQRQGSRHTVVSVRHPTEPHRSFQLEFTDRGRLLERRMMFKYPGESDERLFETHEFSDYWRHYDDGGGSIWFPHQAVYHYYLAPLPDGRRPEYNRVTYKIDKLDFNVPIPEDAFTLDLSQATRVYDGINQKWLEPGAKQAR